MNLNNFVIIEYFPKNLIWRKFLYIDSGNSEPIRKLRFIELERDAGKLPCPVLRGGDRGNTIFRDKVKLNKKIQNKHSER